MCVPDLNILIKNVRSGIFRYTNYGKSALLLAVVTSRLSRLSTVPVGGSLETPKRNRDTTNQTKHKVGSHDPVRR